MYRNDKLFVKFSDVINPCEFESFFQIHSRFVKMAGQNKIMTPTLVTWRWWRFWDVGDKISMLVTFLNIVKRHSVLYSVWPKWKTIIWKLSPTHSPTLVTNMDVTNEICRFFMRLVHSKIADSLAQIIWSRWLVIFWVGIMIMADILFWPICSLPKVGDHTHM